MEVRSLAGVAAVVAVIGCSTASFGAVSNTCPTASPQILNVGTGGSVPFQLVGSDLDGDPLTYQVTQPPLHGVVVLAINTGAGTYSPNPGYCGPDSFAFTVSDGLCTSAPATVSISVACPCPTDMVPSPNCDGKCDPYDAVSSLDCDGKCDATDVAGSPDCDDNCDLNDAASSPDCNGTCDPADAIGSPDCLETTGGLQACSNNVDDDRDGLIDCGDPDCFNVLPCPAKVPVASTAGVVFVAIAVLAVGLFGVRRGPARRQ